MESNRTFFCIHFWSKLILYLLMLALFLKFYFVAQLTTYLESKTSFYTSIRNDKEAKIPGILLCHYYYKGRILERYNVTHLDDLILNSFDYNKTKWELVLESRQSPSHDAIVIYHNHKDTWYKIREGVNNIDDFHIDMKLVYAGSRFCMMFSTNATNEQIDSEYLQLSFTMVSELIQTVSMNSPFLWVPSRNFGQISLE